MSDDQPGNGSGRISWVERLGKAFSTEPRDRDELKAFLEEAARSGIIDSDVLAMMEGALDVSEMHVREAMVPRSQMVVVSIAEGVDEFLPRILESGHSRFPVVGEDRDEVQGVLLAKDLLPFFADPERALDLAQVIRPAVVIPESKRLNVLLRDFRASRNHMAIVVDEYGGVSGLITIEDVLEEIVGEIDDEHDEEVVEQILRRGEGQYRVEALTEIDDFNAYFGAEFSDEDYETIGGLLLAEFGRVPDVGETCVVANRYEFTVASSDTRRIIALDLRVLDAA